MIWKSQTTGANFRKSAQKHITEVLRSSGPVPIKTEQEKPVELLQERRSAVFIGEHWIVVSMIAVLFVAVLALAPIWKKNRFTAIVKEHRELEAELKTLKTKNLILQKEIAIQSSRYVVDSLAKAKLGMMMGETPTQIEVSE